jgi:hypothetical protein
VKEFLMSWRESSNAIVCQGPSLLPTLCRDLLKKQEMEREAQCMMDVT